MYLETEPSVIFYKCLNTCKLSCIKIVVYIGKYMYIYTYVNTCSHATETTYYKLFLMDINVLPNYSY